MPGKIEPGYDRQESVYNLRSLETLSDGVNGGRHPEAMPGRHFTLETNSRFDRYRAQVSETHSWAGSQ